MKRKDIEEFVALTGYLFKIFYKLPRLFFRIATDKEAEKNKQKANAGTTTAADASQKSKKAAEKGQERVEVFSRVAKTLIVHLMNALVMCS